MLRSARARAKSKGLEFNLEESDIIIPEKCPILGIPLEVAEGSCKDASPSLDRYDSNMGYIKGNVEVISFRANTIKNAATQEELKKVYEWMAAKNKG